MSGGFPIAFYAPLKAPDHPSPSGDRRMAQLLMQALTQAGFVPGLASHLRTLDLVGDAVAQEHLAAEGRAEAERLVAVYRALAPEARPRLWFTYHVYYKAPDWIGPRVARALAIPYVVAEGSRAAKRARGPWAIANQAAEAALDAADVIFVMTEADRPALEAARPARQSLVALPPFIDWPCHAAGAGRPPTGGAHLLTVAMMRRGDKLASYRLLAESLASLADLAWHLTIVGDGEARSEVEALFAPLAGRVTFRGLVGEEAVLARLYAGADLFLWPAVNEAYGMAFLEAQACGCPVVAGHFGGVADALRDGETGLLVEPGNAAVFADAVRGLLAAPARREAMAAAARRFIAEERTVAGAAAILRRALLPLLAEEPTA
ncbi:glycosyltransferase family 4 protein [Chelatococcus sp. SYSU_G07232]|uniref:Glycosyltransferase family 4 protein n=1 Tax=Chelatococcus albus TaxID=3047466 RepID=A0ABT7AJB8_9HYPH|nr:glycosyltransferase family 4 protein [Chelatococcus sp. SYSU_G07232]MDJ1159454.1 glycosyltransferase family 4 protein [Chelatococcus sp. SYSU_G07232]